MKTSDRNELLGILSTVVGQKIERIGLICHSYKDQVDREDCWLQLEFVSGLRVYFSGAGDGETLKANPTSWELQFGDNEPKIDMGEFGSSSLIDVSQEEEFSIILKREISRVKIFVDGLEKIRGFQIETNNQLLNYFVESDEGWVFFGNLYKSYPFMRHISSIALQDML